MKKKGFTLVELLAVIAILAILVIMALPAVLRMYRQARIDTFQNEIRKIYSAAQQQFLSDSINMSATEDTIVYSNVTCTGVTNHPLEMTGNSNFEYYIEMNVKGEVNKLRATNKTYTYKNDTANLSIENIDLSSYSEENLTAACLQGLSVLHHGLDGEGVKRSGESLVGALVTHDHGQGHGVSGEIGVHLDHCLSLFLCLFRGGVGGVAFLPEEFRGAEEKPGAHFPAYHVAPLVAHDGEVSPGADPVFIGAPDDGLGSRPDHQLFLELRVGIHNDTLSVRRVHKPVVRDHCALLGESCDVLGFAAEERFGYEKREICVLGACLLELCVQYALHLLPDGVAVWLDHHTTPHRGLLRKVGLHHKIVVPL